MRNWILKLLFASMLFVSMEGIADVVDEPEFHQTHHSHVDEGNGQWFPDSDGSDHEGDACEHFCHVHGIGLAPELANEISPISREFAPAPLVHTTARSTAPPTPPPNS